MAAAPALPTAAGLDRGRPAQHGGRSFGFPIVAATFLAQFAGDGPWAHVDMLGPALLDEDRGDAFGRGATGYGVRMLVELATRLSADGSDVSGSSGVTLAR